MTWEELKEKAKELGSMQTTITDKWILFNGWLKFYDDGTICTETEDSWDEKEIMISYDKMLMIMEALR